MDGAKLWCALRPFTVSMWAEEGVIADRAGASERVAILWIDKAQISLRAGHTRDLAGWLLGWLAEHAPAERSRVLQGAAETWSALRDATDQNGALMAERDRLTEERDRLKADRDSLEVERLKLFDERNAAQAERDAAVAELGDGPHRLRVRWGVNADDEVTLSLLLAQLIGMTVRHLRRDLKSEGRVGVAMGLIKPEESLAEASERIAKGVGIHEVVAERDRLHADLAAIAEARAGGSVADLIGRLCAQGLVVTVQEVTRG